MAEEMIMETTTATTTDETAMQVESEPAVIDATMDQQHPPDDGDGDGERHSSASTTAVPRTTARHLGGGLTPMVLWKDELVILQTTEHTLQVRAWQTGARLGALVIREEDAAAAEDVDVDDAASPARITCLDLTDTSLLVGCANGRLARFDLYSVAKALREHDTSRVRSVVHVGPFRVPGPVLTADQVWTLTDSEKHDTNDQNNNNNFNRSIDFLAALPGDGTVVYVLQQGRHQTNGHDDKKGTRQVYHLRQVHLNRNDNKNTKASVQTNLLDSFTYHPYKPKKGTQKPHTSRIVDFKAQAISSTEHMLLVARKLTIQLLRVVVSNNTSDTATTESNNDHNKAAVAPTTSSLEWNTPFPAPITCVAWNVQALALGLESGEIQLWPHLVQPVHLHLQTTRKTKSKSSSLSPPLVSRILHWHAHPVQTLAMSGNHESTLYSGGEEAVLIQWEFASHASSSAARQRPAAVLPRLAVGSLTHITLSPNRDRILIAAADATLQAYEVHNFARNWHVQLWPLGTASKSNTRHVQLLAPRESQNDQGNTVLVAGVPGQGRVLWYNATQQQVSQSLTIVPRNIVSRTEPNDRPWPPAAVTLAATAAGTLVTLDSQPTENLQQGRRPWMPPKKKTSKMKNDGNDMAHVLESLKFWTLSNNGSNDDGGMKYTCTAIMPAPHGAAHGTTALAVSPAGNMCCTVSNDDKSFRIWLSHRQTHGEGDKPDATTMWRCAYRVAWPAGWARQKVGAVSFSSDGSIVALAYDDSITLWNTDQGSFLTSLYHLGGGSSVQALHFCCKGRLVDTIVSFSDMGIAMQSPFQQCGTLSNMGWTWELPNTDTSFLSHMLLIDEKNVIAVAWYHRSSAYTTFLIIDAAEGTILHEMTLSQNSHVAAMASASSSSEDDISFYAMTAQGNLFLLSTADDKASNQLVMMSQKEADRSVNQGFVGEAPVVAPLLHANSLPRKRTALVLTNTTTDNQMGLESLHKRVKATALDEDDGETRLPRLRGSVTRGFLGRNLHIK